MAKAKKRKRSILAPIPALRCCWCLALAAITLLFTVPP